MDGSEDFVRNRPDYVNGFGSSSGEYWIGLEAIYNLTRRVQKFSSYMMKHDGEIKTANYSSFYIEGADVGYKLNVSLKFAQY